MLRARKAWVVSGVAALLIVNVALADDGATRETCCLPPEGPTGFHIGIGGALGVPLAGAGSNRTPINLGLLLEANYQFRTWYVGMSALIVSGGEFSDGNLRTGLDTRMVTLRGGALFTVGPFTPFVGGGLGYVRQEFWTNGGRLDNGEPGWGDTIEGGGLMADTGVIVLRGHRHWQLIVSSRVIVPFFKFSQPVNQRFPVLVLNLQLMI